MKSQAQLRFEKNGGKGKKMRFRTFVNIYILALSVEEIYYKLITYF